MFGNKKSKYEEQIKEVFSEIAQQRENFESRISELEEVSTCMQSDVSQMMENAGEMVTHAMQNIEDGSELMRDMDEFSKDLKTAVDEYDALCEAMQQQMDVTASLVEENKHYTTPAKYLTEVPNVLRETFDSQETHLNEMSDYCKKMGVMALNAAIEAGRMGDSGKQFVAASEEIRQTAFIYEKVAVSMQEELAASREKIDEMEDIIHHLVSLLKDTNMGAARLLKKAQETNKMAQSSQMRDFSEEMILLRDKVMGMRNLEEEIAKLGERNKIQLSDMREDIISQKQELLEIESDVSHLLDTAEETLR